MSRTASAAAEIAKLKTTAAVSALSILRWWSFVKTTASDPKPTREAEHYPTRCIVPRAPATAGAVRLHLLRFIGGEGGSHRAQVRAGAL